LGEGKELLHHLSMPLDTFDSCVALFGLNDRNIRTLEDELIVNVYLRDGELQIIGDNENIQTAEQVITEMLRIIEAGEHLDAGKIRYLIQMARQGTLAEARDSAGEVVAYTYKGKKIKCKTAGQLSYVQAIRSHGLTLSVGPAGTGKTFLAVAMAAVALRNKEVERLILTRPAVEAGEKLGFLPGDMAQKVDPYLRPLYDALFEILGLESYQRYMERGAIEVAPLAFMRGRTLNDAFIILDEAQNATPEQMKMFLTRMGRNAKAVVNGDPSQIDLPPTRRSGLLAALDVLGSVEGIQIVRLGRDDVVRNNLVQRIVNAYENYEAVKEDNV